MRKCAIDSCLSPAQNCRCNLGAYCGFHGNHSANSFNDIMKNHAEKQAIKIMEEVEKKVLGDIVKGPYEE